MLKTILKPFGQIAVWLGFAKKKEIAAALDKQQKSETPKKIGKILEEEKTLAPMEVITVLQVQKVLQIAAESEPIE